jgi:hypothetical protein
MRNKNYLISFVTHDKMAGCANFLARTLKQAKDAFKRELFGEYKYITKIEIL